MKLRLIYFLVIISSVCYGQVNTDSLENELPNVEGKTKILLLTDLCWYLGMKVPDKAEKYGKKAVILSKKGGYDTLLAQGYNDLGTMYIRTGKYDEATLYLDSCLDKRMGFGDSLGAAKAISKLAVIDEIRSDYASALEKNLKILKIFEAVSNDKFALSTLYGNISVILYNMNQIEKSIEFNDAGYELAKEIKSDQAISTSLVNYGNVYSKIDDHKKAIEYLKEALPLVRNVQNIHSEAVILHNIGSSFDNLNIYDSAEYYLNKALPLRISLNDEKGIMSTKTNLASVFRSQKKYDKAIEYLQTALEVSLKLKTRENTKTIYLNLSKLFDEIGQHEKAYDYHVKFSAIKDSIWSDESSQIVAEMETKYESEKKDAAISLLNKENALEKEKNERQKIVLYAISGGVLLLFGLLITIIRGYNQKKKANEIISQQNEELNQFNEEILAQRDEIENQKNVIELKHSEIQDSINYAKRIQTALLTADEQWKKVSNEHFILFRPKDVVSGDFFWAYTKENIAVWVVADCTGHGVPGAFMSMLGVGFLNEIVAEGGLVEANLILDKLKEKIIHSLSQKGVDTQSKDGMDIALCVLDKSTNKLQYAGAYNPLYIVRNNELTEFKATKQPIGKLDLEVKPFEKQEIEVKNGDWLYTFSDGFIDQFGGVKNKRFGSKRFKELLISSSGQNANLQKMALNLTLKDWMNSGAEQQVDDICVVGVKIE